MSPKVSVLVPIFNAEPFLRECLGSLATQTLDDIEVICLNDGSTDGSRAIIEEYCERDSRFRLVDKINTGYGHSMNVGLEIASGQYVGIVEADDYAASAMFERLHAVASAQQADVVKSNYFAVSTGPDAEIVKIENLPAELIGRVFAPIDEPQVFRMRPAIWSGIYRREFLFDAQIRFLESPGASYQDSGFQFKTWAAAKRAYLLDDAFLHYRIDNAASSVKSLGKIFCVCDEYDSVLAYVARDPEHSDRLTRIAMGVRFEAYRWNMERLGPELRPAFFERVVTDFRTAEEDGVLDQEYFHGRNWRALRQLLRDSSKFVDHDYILRPLPNAAKPNPADQLVSVVMPVHNAEPYLADCLDSILAQTHQKLEVICVNDGSTDGSLEILMRYAARDARVKVFTQENAGAGAARNYGLRQAGGIFLSFLDADDLFKPDMLKRAVAECLRTDADFCVFRSGWFTRRAGDGQEIAHSIRRNLLPSVRIFNQSDIPRDLFGVFNGWAWDKLYRADFVAQSQLLFQELRTTNDMLFVYRALLRARRIVVLDDILAYQRRQVTTSLSRTRERSWGNFYEALLALRADVQELGIYPERERDFVNYALQLSLWQLNTLRGEPYQLLHEKLKGSWFHELGVTGRSSDYFYRANEYAELERILNSTPIDSLTAKVAELREQVQRLEAERARARPITAEMRPITAETRSTTTPPRPPWSLKRVKRTVGRVAPAWAKKAYRRAKSQPI